MNPTVRWPVSPRAAPRAALAAAIVRLAEGFDPAIEASCGQELVQLAIEHMTRRARQPIVRDKKVWLLLRIPLAHRHRVGLRLPFKTSGVW